MPHISTEQTQAMAVKAVEMFLNDKVPLSTGLAKQAAHMQLNSDQIQRAVEATNSIAYLKVLELSDDRTVEFPLCKYAEVMTSITVPTAPIVKQAKVQSSTETMVKQASAEPVIELSDAEKQIEFIKLAALNRSELEALKDREVTIVPELTSVAVSLRGDSQALEKLASVCDGEVFSRASVLVFGDVRTHADTGLFKAAELRTAERVVELLKEASDLSVKIKEKSELHERTELVKQAFLGAMTRGIGHVAGRVVSAPVRGIVNAAGRSATNLKNTVADAGRKVMGKAPVNAPKKKYGLVAGMVAGGSIAGDAIMYSPGKDSTTGRSKDVWTSLQRESL